MNLIRFEISANQIAAYRNILLNGTEFSFSAVWDFCCVGIPQLFDPWTDHNCSCLTTESVEGLALSLESVDDVHSNNSLSLSMLSVGDSIPDHTLQVLLSSGLFVDESWFASHHLVERDVELWALWFPGCCLVRSFSDAWHLPFQVLYHLCLVQTSCCSFLLFNQN